MIFATRILFILSQFCKAKYYSYSYSVIFGRSIIIRIRSFSGDQILFIFGHFRKNEYYSQSYSVIFQRLNIIRIRIRSFSEDRIFFVFIFGHFWKTEYYSYSYSCSVIFRRPNNIHIRIWFSKHYSLTSDIVRLDIDLSYLSPLCI